jgi:hypothetical protein
LIDESTLGVEREDKIEHSLELGAKLNQEAVCSLSALEVSPYSEQTSASSCAVTIHQQPTGNDRLL